jgi:hypothetical protein
MSTTPLWGLCLLALVVTGVQGGRTGARRFGAHETAEDLQGKIVEDHVKLPGTCLIANKVSLDQFNWGD